MKTLILFLLAALSVAAQPFTFHDQAWLGNLWQSSQGGTAQKVDSYIDFHLKAGDNGTNLSRNSLGGSAYGATNWSFNPSGGNKNFTLLALAAGSNETFVTPIQVGGQTFSSTGTNWLRENFQIGATNQPDAILLSFTGSPLVEAQWYFKWSASVTNSTNNINLDSCIFYDSAFGTPEIDYPGYTTNIAPVVYIHGQTTGGGSFTGPATNLQTGVNYLADMIWYSAPNLTNNGMVYVKFFNADAANAFVFGSASYLLASNTVQDQFKRWAGYINLGTNAGAGLYGYMDTSPIWVNYNNVNTNQCPWFPNSPSGALAYQNGSGAATVQWTDSNLQLNPYQIDWTTNAGTAWTTNATNTLVTAMVGATTNLTLIGLTTGMTYQFRVYATFPIAGRQSGFSTSGNVTLTNVTSTFITGGTNGLAGQTAATNGFVFQPSVNMHITKLGFLASPSSFDADNTKQVIVTDSSCHIIAITNVDISAHDGQFHYTTLGAPLALTSGTQYKIGGGNPNAVNFYFNATGAHTGDASIVEDWTTSGGCTGCIECSTHYNYGPNFQYTVP